MLGNFEYSNPTKLYFGEDSLNYLENELKNYGKKILLVYGGGSIKRTGIYDNVITKLKENNKDIIELSGVMSNPTLDKLYEGIQVARDHKIDFILAVGGGSVIDYSKALSVAIHCQSNPWEKYYLKMEPVDNEIIPVGTVLTMVGTGSEMNGGAVITNTRDKLKIGRIFDERLFPKFSILNPKITYTLPKYQMVAGIFDIMSHILEQYFSGNDDNTSDYIMEGLLKSLIHSSEIAINNPEDYEARSNIMWIATWALNTCISKGKTADWMVHVIGQQIGAYTNATHGMTLSAISIPYYKFIMKDGLDKFKRYAINVWNVSADGKTDKEIASEGLDIMKTYMEKLGLVMNIKKLGIKKPMIDEIAKSCPIFNGGYRVLTSSEISIILEQSM